LVIRLSALGDVAMTVPVLSVLTRTYPELKITVVSRKFFEPMFREIPNVDFLEADVYKKHKGFRLLKLAEEAQLMEIDAVADLHNVIRSKILSGYLKLKGVQVATLDKGRKEKKALVKGGDKFFKQLKSTHQRYADVFAQLGYSIKLKDFQKPERMQLTTRLVTLIGKHTKKAIGIAPFAAYKSKMYSLEKMKEVIDTLDKTDQYRIFLFGGGKQEIIKLQQIERQCKNVTNVAGQLNFEDELALISNLDLMLSMDSGNGHLAAMLGIPVLTLWGVTHPYAGFTPFGQPEKNQLLADREKYPLIPTSIYGNKFPEGYENAMDTISVEKVVRKIESLL
jgi:ADP-heptose:LPS heptosyltransferase